MKTLMLLILLVVALTGCSSWNPIARLHPYRIDIQQGNLVTQDMLDKLKPGMSPSQVRFVLGTPLIVDPFHKERWDYVYTLEKDGTLVEKRHITVLFENDKFKGLEGDVKPAAAQAEAKP
jgi:outer membrane protein assembly factor BamE